jgi:hypothetical protein
VTGGPALSGLIEITRLAMMPAKQERKYIHASTKPPSRAFVHRNNKIR